MLNADGVGELAVEFMRRADGRVVQDRLSLQSHEQAAGQSVLIACW
jgi:hypothetical protein